MAEQRKRGRLTSLVGTVVKNAADKTAVVDVVSIKKHSSYNRSVKKRVRYVVHDPENLCEVGDKALIYESKPVSKIKRWRLGKTLGRRRSDGGSEL